MQIVFFCKLISWVFVENKIKNAWFASSAVCHLKKKNVLFKQVCVRMCVFTSQYHFTNCPHPISSCECKTFVFYRSSKMFHLDILCNSFCLISQKYPNSHKLLTLSNGEWEWQIIFYKNKKKSEWAKYKSVRKCNL